MTFLSVEIKDLMTEAINHKVFDRETGEEIYHVVWANDETGEYCQLLSDMEGNFMLDEYGASILRRIRKGNIEFRRVSE